MSTHVHVQAIVRFRLSLGAQTGMAPDNLKSLLLAPIENVIVPFGLAHP